MVLQETRLVALNLRAATLMAGGAIALAPAGYAAGGHHGVDDASLIAPGQCEAEGWATREAASRLLHTGLGCRVGAVELAAAFEHERDDGSSRTGGGLQVKWAREWTRGFSAGVSVSGGWEAHQRPRYQGTTVSALFSWAVRDRLALHANIGRDFLNGQPNVARSGASVEWSPLSPRWLIEVERYVEDETQFARAGLRWFANDRWTIDVSRARHLGGARASNWTLGATYAFDR